MPIPAVFNFVTKFEKILSLSLGYSKARNDSGSFPNTVNSLGAHAASGEAQECVLSWS